MPVKIVIDGQQRTVMATPAEAADIQRGSLPPVRSFTVGGQTVPWYAYQQYDPYRDYWAYQNLGWSTFAGDVVAGFIGAELFNSVLAPCSYYGGWSSPPRLCSLVGIRSAAGIHTIRVTTQAKRTNARTITHFRIRTATRATTPAADRTINRTMALVERVSLTPAVITAAETSLKAGRGKGRKKPCT